MYVNVWEDMWEYMRVHACKRMCACVCGKCGWVRVPLSALLRTCVCMCVRVLVDMYVYVFICEFVNV